MDRIVMALADLDPTQVAVAGSKGARLGALMRIEGVRVPAGFVVTTDVFEEVVAPPVGTLLEGLAGLGPDDAAGRTAVGARLRQVVEEVAVPDEVTAAITAAVDDLGEQVPVAVRSSATAEDLPTASFAGQLDSFLDVVGSAAVLDRVRRCWASLFTDRAIAYRQQHGIDHRTVAMAVVVQVQLDPQAAGVLFTADPVTGNRKVASVEAVPGLGDALVAGRATPDEFQVLDGTVVAREVAAADAPTLTDAQVLALVELGRRVEAHLGHPQDLEWCLVDGDLHVVQARPITTLFPVPATEDEHLHVYVSVGHQQMMTDPMTPMGLSVWQLTSPAPMVEAGGRLFVDVTRALASPATRDGMVVGLGRSDPLIGDALQRVLDRDDLVARLPAPAPPPTAGSAPTSSTTAPPAHGTPPADAPPAPHAPHAPSEPLPTDPAIVAELVANAEGSLAALERDLAGLGGTALLDRIAEDIPALRTRLFDPRNLAAITAGLDAARWLDEHLAEWLGERGAADRLAQSAPGNVTAEMGLALLDVADAIRPHPDVVAFLEEVEPGDDDFLDELARVPGGEAAGRAIVGFLDRYGMRCVGEIDVGRPRWRERPTALLPMLLGNVRNAEPGAGPRRFEAGRQEAERTAAELLARVRALPDGDRKADELAPAIDRLRTFVGYREFPKYAMVSRYLVYRQAVLREAEALVQAGVLDEVEDAFLLRFEELREAVRTGRVDARLVADRRAAFASYGALTPPRVMTSDGEVVTGTYRRDGVPDGALIGLGVSTGVVEGRARVVADMAEADLEPGDVLVTAFTDPSWTPVFVTAAALVTEVGGLMTHGAVIAPEYGLPAVVGVEDATRRIRDGQRIRVDGTDGVVEILG